MRRRTLLASLATLTAVGGCVNDGSGPATQPAGNDSPTESPSPTDAPTDTRTMTESPPRPDPATDVFADVDCPSFDDHADETVCYHTVDVDDADVVLTAESEVFDPALGDGDVETLEFVCYNRSEWPISFNPYAWGIERYDDGEWTHVAPEMYPEPMTEVDAGGTYRWVLPTGTATPASDERAKPISVALESGVYAFHLTVSYDALSSETPTDRPKPEGRVELVALFRVEEAFDPDAEEPSSRETETGSS